MHLTRFLHALSESGRVVVPASVEESDADLVAADAALAELDAVARATLAFDAPRFLPDVAHWAAITLYRGAQLVAHRDLEAAEVERRLGTPCPDRERHDAADVAYSADLALRFLPDLERLAVAAARGDDPLVERLRDLGREWPLSSVGLRAVDDAAEPDAAALDVVLGHPALRQLYVDRILTRDDTGRLGSAGVREAVRESLGLYPELGGKVARLLEHDVRGEPEGESA